MRKKKLLTYALLFLVIALFAAIRFRLRNMPLERDEGEYAYVGQLMLQGIPPYELAYTMKLPGTHAAYAVIEILFGQTPAGIHIGLLLLNAATTILVYLLAVRLTGLLGGLVAAATYALLSTSFAVLGFSAHATHFVVIAALAGILLLRRAVETRRAWQLLASGLLLGLAFLMKQPGIAFAAFGGVFLLKREFPHLVKLRDLVSGVGVYVVGVSLPFVLTCLILSVAGVFDTFRFWVFTYAREYASELSLSFGVQAFKDVFPTIVAPAIGVWVLAALGLTTFLWHRESRSHAGFVAGLLLCSFLAMCPGLFFREHYFILVLPAVALLVAFATYSFTKTLSQKQSGPLMAAIPALLFSVAFGYAVFQQRATFFETDPLLACQERYGDNPFPEAVVIAQYLNANSSPTDRVAVLGSEPEIYFYAKRRSATGFIYMYGLMEQQEYSFEMQKQMIREIESAHPRFLVTVASDQSWLPLPGSQQVLSFSAWSQNYLGSHYELVGVADRVSNRSEFRSGEEAQAYQPVSQATVEIFRRID